MVTISKGASTKAEATGSFHINPLIPLPAPWVAVWKVPVCSSERCMRCKRTIMHLWIESYRNLRGEHAGTFAAAAPGHRDRAFTWPLNAGMGLPPTMKSTITG